ncbi:MAG: hypothetical protein VKO00_00050 [Cyanobacteriota bacterium]|nr:hypothetical protein [Cyanobacteriota bacterium]
MASSILRTACGLLAAQAALSLTSAPAQAAILTYTDRDSFVAALAGRSGFEDHFSGLSYGATAVSDTITANGLSVTYSAPSGGLFGLNGALSTFTATDALVITLTGGVYALGGTFLLTDLAGALSALAPGQAVIATADNGIDPLSTLSSATNTSATFFGWISSTPLQRVESTGGGASPNRWNTIDAMVFAGAEPLAVPGPLPLAGAVAAFHGARRLRRRLTPPGC